MLVEEKETAEEIINKIEEARASKGFDWARFLIKLKREYGLLPKYPTLREYIRENSRGAYHNFIFHLGSHEVRVSSVFDFESIYKKELLDMFVVTGDRKEDNGGNCENYECNHYLEIEAKEE